MEIRVRVVNNKHNLKFKNQYLTRFLIKIQHFISHRTAAYDVLFIQKMKVEYSLLDAWNIIFNNHYSANYMTISTFMAIPSYGVFIVVPSHIQILQSYLKLQLIKVACYVLRVKNNNSWSPLYSFGPWG